jgi:hypothetical protein
VDLARTIRIAFSTTPRISPQYQKLVFNEQKHRLKKLGEQMKAAGKSDDEIRAEMDKLRFDILLSVYNDVVGGPEFIGIIQDIAEKSKDFARKKKGGGNPAHDQAMACLLATLTVMYGGAQTPLYQQNLPLPAIDKVDRTSALWTDWVPGDWGYIENTGKQKPSPGYEGENIVSIGDALFWAHFNPKKPINPLADLFAMVQNWNDEKAAKLHPIRRFPAAGLV